MASRPDLPPLRPRPIGQSMLNAELVHVVDRQPETAGLGVVLIQGGLCHRLRQQGDSGATVVFELHERRPLAGAGRPARTAPPPTTNAGIRTHTTSTTAEWLGLGFNCGGAALAWIGVVGTGALAPVTGGASAVGTAILWGGAIASSGQCAVSLYRVGNDHRGRRDINDALDASLAYVWTMRGADVVGLVGAAGALKELKATHAVLAETGADWKLATAGKISRPMRRRLTTALELQGGRRVAGKIISRLVKQRLLDGAAGVLGMVSSSVSGVAHEIAVWITEETDGKPAQ